MIHQDPVHQQYTNNAEHVTGYCVPEIKCWCLNILGTISNLQGEWKERAIQLSGQSPIRYFPHFQPATPSVCPARVWPVGIPFKLKRHFEYWIICSWANQQRTVLLNILTAGPGTIVHWSGGLSRKHLVAELDWTKKYFWYPSPHMLWAETGHANLLDDT